jgi:hypothetical protein
MQSYWVCSYILGALFAVYWVYPVVDPLLARFATYVTWTALGALFVLRLMPGFALGTAFALLRKRAPTRGP